MNFIRMFSTLRWMILVFSVTLAHTFKTIVKLTTKGLYQVQRWQITKQLSKIQ